MQDTKLTARQYRGSTGSNQNEVGVLKIVCSLELRVQEVEHMNIHVATQSKGILRERRHTNVLVVSEPADLNVLGLSATP